MPKNEFSELVDLHLAMQAGCYFSGVDLGPRGTRYAWSQTVPDTAWNVAFTKGRPSEQTLDWVFAAAEERRRQPALLVEKQFPLSAKWEINQKSAEHWMVLPLPGDVEFEPESGLIIRTTASATPPGDFLRVFGALFDDEETNNHFETCYVPTLASAHASPGVECIQLVGYSADKAVSCGSVYIKSGVAGLYNVGTIRSQQQRGFGRSISATAIQEAASRGCRAIFLQCEPGTHVESLYRGLGFSVVQTPICLEFSRA